MRKSIVCYINGIKHELVDEHAFMTLSDYLRYQKGMTGTKVVCAEGDCGACTILVARFDGKKLSNYHSINSCISKMYLMDKCHIITVEGIGNSSELNIIQEVFVDEHGAQCGYCTPGFICSLAAMAEDLKRDDKKQTSQKVKNYLTGNLCRCTGYQSIIDAGMKLELNKVNKLAKLYPEEKIAKGFLNLAGKEVHIQTDELEVFLPVSMDSAIEYMASNHNTRLISGGTDLGVVSNKGKIKLNKMLTLNNINEAYEVKEMGDFISIGAKVSLDKCEKTLKNYFPDFSRMLHIFASPQIKNSGTLVGNLVNASPIADTTPFLFVAKAKIVLKSQKGERTVEIRDFFKGGYKELDLAPGEFVTSILIPKTNKKFKLYKVSLRKDLDISAVTFAASYDYKEDKLNNLTITYGGVGPTIIEVTEMQRKLMSQKFTMKLCQEVAKDFKTTFSPFSDHRGSKEFRYQVCENLLYKFYDEVSSNIEASV